MYKIWVEYRKSQTTGDRVPKNVRSDAQPVPPMSSATRQIINPPEPRPPRVNQPLPSASPLEHVTTCPPRVLQHAPRRCEDYANLSHSGLRETHRAMIALVPRGDASNGEVIELRGVEVNLEPLGVSVPRPRQDTDNNLIISPTVYERESTKVDILASPPTYEEATSVTGQHIFRQV